MNGMIMDIKRFSIQDGPGIRTTVFLKGCSLHCAWCHNPEGISPYSECAFIQHKCINCGECLLVCSSKAQSIDSQGVHHFNRGECVTCGKCEAVCLGHSMKLYGTRWTVEKTMQVVLEDRDFFSVTGGGVTISGGEPLSQPAFTTQLLKSLRGEDIHTAIDTSGDADWSVLERTIPYTCIYLYDLKHIDSKMHKMYTGKGNERILDNLRKLSSREVEIEIRIPCIPNINMDDCSIMKTIEYICALPRRHRVRLLPYHRLARSKYTALGNKPEYDSSVVPSQEVMNEICSMYIRNGIDAFW